MALATLVAPALGVVAAVATWDPALATANLTLFGAMFVVTTLGITMGYHRYFTHRSFDARRSVQVLLAIAGSMAGQGPLVFWVAAHRRHHRFSDEDGDPHSPHDRRGGWRGLVHAHVGWMLDHQPEDWRRYAPDLLRKRLWLKLNFAYPWWLLGGLALPAAAGALWSGHASGALGGLLWGGLARMFAVHHTTWSVNSICHLFGRRPYATGDRSTNHAWVALLTFGEGWHNNHHAFPTSARHGLRWWQVDATYLAVRVCALLRLVDRVHLPARHQLERKTRDDR